MTEPPVPAAQYLRMSTEHQQYSLDFQTSVIRSYAAAHGFVVVKTYTDAGKSGLVLKNRKGLAQLLHDVVARGQLYRAVLVYDVSRWGRFQDADEAAHYEYMCKKSGIPVVYCAESFSSESTMPNAVMKALKRAMAAEYSRELSEKTTLAMTRLVEDGLWPGSMPGYGLRRMLVSNDRTPKQQMKFRERKNLTTDRTILVPGPPEEIEVVKTIFRLYTQEKISFPAIARTLNDLGVPRGCNDRPNGQWTYQAVRQIILNEKYTGTLIWGRYTQKLRSRYAPAPRERWIVVHDVFKPIVDRDTFEAAHAIWSHKSWQLSDEQYLERLRSLLKRKGRLNARLINESSSIPSCSAYESRFGSLHKVYELIGYKRTDTFRLRKLSNVRITGLYRSLYRRLRRLFPDLRATHESPRARPKTLCFSTGLKVAIAICHAEKTLRGEKRWRFESLHAQRSGLIALLCFCDAGNKEISHFILMPSASHIATISMLKERDERLDDGVRLRYLRDFRRLAHLMGKVAQP